MRVTAHCPFRQSGDCPDGTVEGWYTDEVEIGICDNAECPSHHVGFDEADRDIILADFDAEYDSFDMAAEDYYHDYDR